MEDAIKTMQSRLKRLEILTIAFGVVGLFLRFWLPNHSPTQVQPAANTNSVNIGDATPVTTTQRDFLTVHEVATREGLSARTITEYIATGRIDPPPTRNGTRPWAIAADYRILPLTADNSGGE